MGCRSSLHPCQNRASIFLLERDEIRTCFSLHLREQIEVPISHATPLLCMCGTLRRMHQYARSVRRPFASAGVRCSKIPELHVVRSETWTDHKLWYQPMELRYLYFCKVCSFLSLMPGSCHVNSSFNVVRVWKLSTWSIYFYLYSMLSINTTVVVLIPKNAVSYF